MILIDHPLPQLRHAAHPLVRGSACWSRSLPCSGVQHRTWPSENPSWAWVPNKNCNSKLLGLTASCPPWSLVKHAHFQPSMRPGTQPSILSLFWVRLCWPVSPIGPCSCCPKGLGEFGKHVLVERVRRNLGPLCPGKHQKHSPSQAWSGSIAHGLDSAGGRNIQCLDCLRPQGP